MKPVTTTLTAVLLSLAGIHWASPARACEEEILVQSWYDQYLGRPADPCGLRNWTRELRFCPRPEVVLAAFLASEEYYCRNGHTPEGFVAGLYADVLGRPACAAEIHQWVCRFHRCGCRKRLALEFLDAARVEQVNRLRLRPAPGPVPVPGPVPTPSFVPPAGVPPYELPTYGDARGRYGPSRGIRVQLGYRGR